MNLYIVMHIECDHYYPVVQIIDTNLLNKLWVLAGACG